MNININNLTTEERCQLIADLLNRELHARNGSLFLTNKLVIAEVDIIGYVNFHPKQQLKDDDVVMCWNTSWKGETGVNVMQYEDSQAERYDSCLPFDANLAGKLLKDWPEEKLIEGKRNGGGE